MPEEANDNNNNNHNTAAAAANGGNGAPPPAAALGSQGGADGGKDVALPLPWVLLLGSDSQFPSPLYIPSFFGVQHRNRLSTEIGRAHV